MNDRINLSSIRACVFDAYGTLLDFNSAVTRERNAIGSGRVDRLAEIWRRKQLEYTWLRSLMRRHADFRTVTGDALDYSLAALGINDTGLRTRLMEACDRLETFPEVPAVLAELKRRGMATAILSNGSPSMLDAGIASAGIGDSLDAVLSVENAGVFKPAPEVYQLATARFGIAAGEVLFMSSNGWDIHGAASFGFRCVWINRSGAPAECLPGAPVLSLSSLTPLPRLFGD